jgi:hypothetical protein
MLRRLRLIPILAIAAFVLILNPNRTPVTLLAVAVGAVLAVFLVDDQTPMPTTQAQARRWFLYPAFGVLIVAPFLLAPFSDYPFRDAIHMAGLTAVGPAVAVISFFVVRRFAR